MPPDVFISYATPDEPAALTVFELLEAQSLSSWIAVRSIPPGTEWEREVATAIGESRLLLVLLSQATDLSPWVAREIKFALTRHMPLLPVRIARFDPTPGLAFLISSQYLNAFPRALSDYHDEIVQSVRRLMRPLAVSAPAAPEVDSATDVRTRRPTATPDVVATAGETVAEPIAPVAAGPEPAPVREVIGFDLGHGETAVAKAALHSHAHPKLVALGGKHSQVSALGFHPVRGFVLGEEAILDPALKSLVICFKEPPGRHASSSEIVSEYFGAYYRALVAGGHIRGLSESHFFVGCPSAWSRAEMTAYEEILLRGGVPRLTVVKESRAALLNVVESGGITQEELRTNVLIIDVGSSTTDLTLVTGATTEAPMDFGLELGAALIDRQIFEHTVLMHPQREALQSAVAADVKALERCEFRCRRVKEEYFSNEPLYRTSGRAVSLGMETLDGGLSFCPSVNTPLMDRILSTPLPVLGQKSWIDAFRTLLLESRDRLQAQACTPAAVVATGGASKMAFVQRICEDVFPQSKFRRDEEPEASIARGLALWGRVYLRTADFEAAVTDIAEQQIPGIVTRRAGHLIKQIAPAAAQALIDVAVRPSLLAWQAGKIKTIAKIEPTIQARVKRWLAGPDFSTLVGDAVEAWTPGLQAELNDLTDAVCRRYAIPLGSLAISPALRRISSPSLNAAESVTSGVVESMVVGLIVAAGALLMLAGPGGWMVAAISSIVGVSRSADQVRKMNILTPLRSTLLDVDTCTKEMKVKLERSFTDELKSGGTMAEMSAQISSELKSVLLDRADEARLLIR